MISSLELAALCGVSQGTVDRALHGRTGISAATRERILAAAEAHGYRPNPAARELMGRTPSKAVGVAVPASTLQQPFFLDLFANLAKHLHAEGLHPSIWVAADDSAGVSATVEAMAARRLRALVLIGPPMGLHIAPSILKAQPVLSLMLPCAQSEVRLVGADEHGFGRVATEHLIALGHRRIVHLMGDKALHAVRVGRRDGYLAAMAAAGLEPRVWPLTADAPDLVERLKADGITGIFCHHDPMAVAVQRRLAAAGVSVPGAISLVSIDASPVLAAYDLGISSVPYPYEGLAQQAADILAGRPARALPVPTVRPGRTSAPVR